MLINEYIEKKGIDLSDKNRDKLDSYMWDTPSEVYGKIFSVSRGEDIDRKYFIKILQSARYSKVERIKSEGDYLDKDNSVVLYRRSFIFPWGYEHSMIIEVEFGKDKIERITNVKTKEEIGTVSIDPRLLTYLYSSDESRISLPLVKYPKKLIEMLIEVEDRGFYNHYGLEPTAIFRAAYRNLTTRNQIQGGSTITQQVVKNIFLSRERSIERKLKEAILSLVLEKKLTKDSILEIYLNEIYLGQDGDKEIRGFALASMYYFGRPINELDLSQLALLIGMAKGASFYNPWISKDEALKRRNLVLKIAYDQGVITYDDFKNQTEKKLTVRSKNDVFSKHPGFINTLSKELREINENVGVEVKGTKILTTFDPIIQYETEQAVMETMKSLTKVKGYEKLQSVMIVAEKKSGNILSIVSDKNVTYNGLNRALNSHRQIGSMIKPGIYAAALSQPQLYSLRTWLDDNPVIINSGANNDWHPRNVTRIYSDKIFLLDALAKSVNVPTVNLGMTLGLEEVANVFIDLGIPEKDIKVIPSMLLGSYDLTPMDLLIYLQTLSNYGEKTGISTIVEISDKDGNKIYSRDHSSTQTIPEQAAWLTLYAMQESVRNGTSRKMELKFPHSGLAAKTGTSSNLRDSWFTAIDDKYILLAWIGNDDNSPTKLYGSTGAMVIADRFFERIGIKKMKLKNMNGIVYEKVLPDGTVECNKNNDNQFASYRIIPAWKYSDFYKCSSVEQFSPLSYKKKYDYDNLSELF